jgi:hypothetical protein
VIFDVGGRNMKYIMLLVSCLAVVACSRDPELIEYKLNEAPSDSNSIENVEKYLDLWVGEYRGTCDKLSPEQKALKFEFFQLTILTGDRLSVSYSNHRPNRHLLHVTITLPKEPQKFAELALSEKIIQVSTTSHPPKEKFSIEKINSPIGEELVKGTVFFYIRLPEGKSKEAFRLVFTAERVHEMQQETTEN